LETGLDCMESLNVTSGAVARQVQLARVVKLVRTMLWTWGRAGKAVGTGLVLEGGDDPVLGLDRREPGQARALHELQHRVVRRPGV
jgi:hypothetical protein